MAAVGGVAGKKENCDTTSEVVSISQTPTESSTITTGADTGLYLQPAMPLESTTQPETVKSFLISSHEHIIDKQCVETKLKDEVAFFLIGFVFCVFTLFLLFDLCFLLFLFSEIFHAGFRTHSLCHIDFFHFSPTSIIFTATFTATFTFRFAFARFCVMWL